MPYAEDSRTLVYYNSGGETWGTPLVISKSNSGFYNMDFSIYPNPAKSILNILNNNSTQNLTIELYNIVGTKLITKTIDTGNNSINISSLADGVYFYQIKSENEVLETGKFVKE